LSEQRGEAVLDASAVLAFLQDEEGAEIVYQQLPNAVMSAVNAAEVLGKLVSKGMPMEDAVETLDSLRIGIVPFSEEEAAWSTRFVLSGLSLGDRACLATAAIRHQTAYTADHRWESVSGSTVVVSVIRQR
jgi:PIN domain nuclease of toxin-antitoxin system